jgi:hypothetical protein
MEISLVGSCLSEETMVVDPRDSTDERVLKIPICHAVLYAFSRSKNRATRCWQKGKVFSICIPGSSGAQVEIYGINI